MEQISYELIEIDKANWNGSVEDIVPDLMFKSEYVELLSQSFNFNLRHIVIKEKGIINLIAIIFFRKQKVVFADNYTYQPLWINPTISERRQNAILTHFILYLKSNFSSVKLKLNPLIADIRPFKWEGFNVEPRFTYLRFRNALIHKKIAFRLKKQDSQMAGVLMEDPSLNDISINIDFLKRLKFKKTKANSYFNYLLGLKALGYVKSFTLKDENNVICAYLVLIDPGLKRVYTLMVNGADRNHRHIHSLIYKKIINWADEHDFETVDFCGANMKGISNFKSYFNPELQLYYIVRYSFIQRTILFFTEILNKF